MESVTRDTSYGARSLMRQPLSASLIVLTLALGIGANSAIFTLLNVLLFRPLPYADADRLVTLLDSFDRAGVTDLDPMAAGVFTARVMERVVTVVNRPGFLTLLAIVAFYLAVAALAALVPLYRAFRLNVAIVLRGD